MGVLFADTASLISSNFLATDVAANFKLFSPPIRSSLDFFDVRLLGLKRQLREKARKEHINKRKTFGGTIPKK